jgi:hypothetical protein
MLAEMDPSTWEGAAYQMGNTPQTWQAHYNPKHRKRAMQGAVESNATFRERVGGAQPQPLGTSASIMVMRHGSKKRRVTE